MTYNHISIDELTWIEAYWERGEKVAFIAQKLNRSLQTIYNVINLLKQGHTVQEYYTRCGAKKKILSQEDVEYVREKNQEGWTPDVIIGCNERDLGMSVRTLYRRYQDTSELSVQDLPMRGQRKPNNHQEKRRKQAFKRGIKERNELFPNLSEEFGHFEGDTIVWKKHKSGVITLVEVKSKLIVTLKPNRRTAKDIEERLHEWLSRLPRNFIKTIIFDCGKEFSNWKSLCNEHDINIFFTDPGCPSQRGLNENSNGLLRKDGLPKQMDFNQIKEEFAQSIAHYRNNIPRKSLDYLTPIEVFKEYIEQFAA